MSAARPDLVGANECMLSAAAAAPDSRELLSDRLLALSFFFPFLFVFLLSSSFHAPLSREALACLAAAISASHLRYFRRSWPTDAGRRGGGDTEGSRKDQRGTTQGSLVLARRRRAEGRV